MNTERLLLRLARTFCDRVTRETIVEPLLADLQHEVAAAQTLAERRAIRRRGAYAFLATLSLCACRAVIRAPARATLMGTVITLYWMATVGLVLFGMTWLRKGTLSISDGALTLRWMLGLFGPMLLPAFLRHKRGGHLSMRFFLATFALATAVCVAIVPDHRLQHLEFNGGYFLVFVLTSASRARVVKDRA